MATITDDQMLDAYNNGSLNTFFCSTTGVHLKYWMQN